MKAKVANLLAAACGVASMVCLFMGIETRLDLFFFACIAFEALVAILLLSLLVFGINTWLSTVGGILAGISFWFWCFGLPGYAKVIEAAYRDETEKRFKRVVKALLQYTDYTKVRRFPPAALYGKNGRPLLSWRVLILPYLGEKEIFSQFKLDEPWNSAHNLGLLPLMPEVYEPPIETGIPRDEYSTFLQVFVGPRTAFGCPGGCRFPTDFPGESWKTILLVQSSRAVPWTKPEDIVFRPEEPLPLLGPLAFRAKSRFFNITPPFFIADASGAVEAIAYGDQDLIASLGKRILRE